jgi:hypothetical protein
LTWLFSVHSVLACLPWASTISKNAGLFDSLTVNESLRAVVRETFDYILHKAVLSILQGLGLCLPCLSRKSGRSGNVLDVLTVICNLGTL